MYEEKWTFEGNVYYIAVHEGSCDNQIIIKKPIKYEGVYMFEPPIGLNPIIGKKDDVIEIELINLPDKKYVPDTDHQTASEMDAISQMLNTAEFHGLQAEVVCSLLLNIKKENKDIADECANAVCEWVK